jgi:gamma-glutamyltranspeptidase/glutathione hydrolase
MTFTTRPEIRGTFGVATSTHWIASAVGMSILERGGNAFDAAVATAITLQVVEPHLNGPAGDMPAIFQKAGEDVQVVCAQAPAPAGATLEHYRAQNLTLIPGSGLLATVIPGAFDGWMLMLRDHGTMSLRDVLTPAIDYARDGHPILPRVANTIAGLADYFAEHWPTSAAVWTPNGKAPAANALFKNPDLADTYDRLVTEGEAAGDDRIAQIGAARRAWSEGFVADAIDAYVQTANVMDVSNEKHMGVLTKADMAGWSATYEPSLSYDYHGWTVHKTGPWSQGPVLLQALAILKHFDLAAMDPMGAEFTHTVIEAMKLAYADREAYYGDPLHSEIPMEYLLSDAYNAERAKMISAQASTEQRPGRVPGFEHQADAYIARAAHDFGAADAAPQEPTMAHLTEKRGDTVHLDIIDRWGNMVAATPSGVAAVEPRRARPWLSAEFPRADVLARGWLAHNAGPRPAPAHNADAVACNTRGRPPHGLWHAGRRPAGPVATGVVLALCALGHGAAGLHGRAFVSFHALPRQLLPPRGQTRRDDARARLWRRHHCRSAGPRSHRTRGRTVVRWPPDSRLARPGRHHARRRHAASDASLCGGALSHDMEPDRA